MGPAPCKECGRRPKANGRHRCVTCHLRNQPIGEQVRAAEYRLAMVPEEMRVKRTKAVLAQAPKHTSWCAGCQSFRDLVDFANGATKCRACVSAKAHAAMIARTYGMDSAGYAALLNNQGGKCAICRSRPKSKRLAVDHDHKTGAVRGLLCSRCNHDLMGSAWDSLAVAAALWHYLNTPPASGAWTPPETAPPIGVLSAAESPNAGLPLLLPGEKPDSSGAANLAAAAAGCNRPHALPAGSITVPGKRGVWKVFVEPGGDAPF